MYQNWVLVGAAIADELCGTTLKLEKGVGHIVCGHDLVYVSNSKKYQILGEEPVKWSENDFKNEKEFVQTLTNRINEQVRNYRNKGQEIMTLERYREVCDEFEAEHKADYLERRELEMWSKAFNSDPNPIFQDLVSFINTHLEIEEIDSISDSHYRELTTEELHDATVLARFLGVHSNDLLREGAEWIPEWIEDH